MSATSFQVERLHPKTLVRNGRTSGQRLGVKSLHLIGFVFLFCGVRAADSFVPPAVLARHVERFNTMEDEPVVNVVPNAAAGEWLQANIPLFACPEPEVEEMYYFRWWAMRKHLRHAPVPAGANSADAPLVFTEFINRADPVSSALGHHVMEGRWLHDATISEQDVRWWLRGNGGKPQPKLHNYSQWLAYALWQRALVTGDTKSLVELLDDLVADYRQWEMEKLVGPALAAGPSRDRPDNRDPAGAGAATTKSTRPPGLFWQFDVRDAMEESISGSRTKKNLRPTINSYMFGNAQAIAAIARLAGRNDVATEFDGKATILRQLTQATLWNAEAKFFEARLEDGAIANVREEIGFIPWYFHLPEPGRGYEAAWAQLKDDRGFRAPFGIMTAERRHPQFRTHGVGGCEWDGAAWPFATSQTLTALGNVLRDYPQDVVTNRDYFDAFRTYVKSQHWGDKPYLGEYLDEQTGAWLKGPNPRSRWYNHSTFADLLITGVVGLRPRADNTVEIWPLLPAGTWRWFALEGVKYHGRVLSIVWDDDGSHYGRGRGLAVFADGRELGRIAQLGKLSAPLP
jgi:hypothetical protein